jgi:hypothetical protein
MQLRGTPVALLLLLCAALVGIMLFALAQKVPAILVFFCLFGAVGGIVARRWGRVESRIFVLVYCVAVCAAIVLYTIYVQRYDAPYYIGGSDDLVYEHDAQAVVSSLDFWEYGGIRGGVVKPSHNSVGYVYLVSLIYRVAEPFGGFHTMLPRLLNCLTLGMLAVLSYRLAKLHGLSERTSRWCALVVGLLPIMVYNSIHTFRDIIVSLLTLLVVYLWASNHRVSGVRTRLILWAQTLVIALVVSQLRMAQAVAILTIALIGDLLSSRTRIRTFSAPGLYRLAVIVLVLVAVLFVLPNTVGSFAQRLVRGQSGYTEYRLGLSDGLAARVFGAPVPLTYVLRIPYALITPLPVLSKQLERLWLSLGTVAWYLLLPFFVLGFAHSARCRARFQLLGAFLLLFGGTALISFSERHVSQFLPYGILLAGVGWERYRRHRIPLFLGILWLGCGLSIGYMVLKAAG